jgi:cellulose synthase/poly-beta-1,6-N-acetylglucosamine synthase-like glycosyltransferase
MLPNKSELAIIIPAFNEERVIGASLKVLTRVIHVDHIYVVSDGSVDRTVEIAEGYGVNVLGIKNNLGKAGALAAVIDAYKLVDKYEYLLFSDADSRLEPNFLDLIRPYLKDRPACIVGTVCSDRHGVISAYRTFEYGYGFHIIKRAQNVLRMITVAPGCASLYRSDIGF